MTEHKIVTKTDTIEALYEGCKARNREAQKKLYQLTASAMLGLCLRYTNDRAEAEDILQAGFVRVFTQIDSYRRSGSFEGWIRRIMINTAIEAFRRRKRMLQLSEIDEQLEEKIPAPQADHMNYEELVRLIQQLPDGYRMVFNMYAIEGYSHREISKTLNISESTSKSQLLRARDWLKKRIKHLEGEFYESRQG